MCVGVCVFISLQLFPDIITRNRGVNGRDRERERQGRREREKRRKRERLETEDTSKW